MAREAKTRSQGPVRIEAAKEQLGAVSLDSGWLERAVESHQSMIDSLAFLRHRYPEAQSWSC